MTQVTFWALICGGLLALELLTGTFYLLMLAIGGGAALIAAALGFSLQIQLLSAAAVGALAVTAWYRHRKSHPGASPGSDINIHMDVGQSVEVSSWNEDGSTSVRYRGAAWQARYQGTGQPQPGRHTICGLDGSQLLLKP